MSRHVTPFLIGVCAAVLLSGCGGGSKAPIETLVPAGGTLLVDDKPLDGVVITFTPIVSKETAHSQGGTAQTDANGAFTVTNVHQNKPGLAAGKYALTFSRMRLADGSAAPVPPPGSQPDPANIQVETLPGHLTLPNPSSPVSQVDIPKEGNTKLEVKISTKG